MSTPTSTRQRSSKQSSDLPPKRQGKVVRHDVSKPLQNISLSRVVNLLTIFAVLFTAFYVYRLFQWKTQVGGWWNLALGRPPQQMNMHHDPRMGGSISRVNTGTNQEVALESHVHAIASILGMQPTDLASALSDVVHQHVAPKTISSLSSSVSSSASSAPAASALLHSTENVGDVTSNDAEGMVGKAGTVAKAVEAVVSLDEPFIAD